MSTLVTVIGWIGAGLLLYGYAMVSGARMAADGMRYQVFNLTGSVSLMINTGYHGAWPSVILNAVWAGIGIVAVVKIVRIKRAVIGATQ